MGGTVPYHQRICKNIDREIFADLLLKLCSVFDIPKYTYVGLGGPYLEDFKLLHKRFDLNKMISLESNEHVLNRQQFNLPHTCIDCRKITSGEFIDDYDIEENAIIWLDYTTAELREQFDEIYRLIPKMIHGDILKVTLVANPDTLLLFQPGEKIEKEEKNSKRLDELNKKISEYLPHGVSPEDMSMERLPAIFALALKNVVNKSLYETPDYEFRPLLSLRYTDLTHQILTITGILLKIDSNVSSDIDKALQNWPISVTDLSEPVREINVPAFSMKEKMYVDSFLPTTEIDSLQERLGIRLARTETKSQNLLKNYAELYRYYPSFHKITI